MTTEISTHDQVLAMTAAGQTPRVISKQLDIATQTVYRHLKRAGIRPAQVQQ